MKSTKASNEKSYHWRLAGLDNDFMSPKRLRAKSYSGENFRCAFRFLATLLFLTLIKKVLSRGLTFLGLGIGISALSLKQNCHKLSRVARMIREIMYWGNFQSKTMNGQVFFTDFTSKFTQLSFSFLKTLSDKNFIKSEKLKTLY